MLNYENIEASLNITSNDSYLDTIRISHLKEFILKFKEFNLVLHYENNTIYFCEDLLKILVNMELMAVSVVQYDTMNFQFHRPSGIKFINLVILKNPRKFSFFSASIGNLIVYDLVIFVILKKVDDIFWTMDYLQLAKNVFILDLSKQNKIVVQDVCYYCGKESYRLNQFHSSFLSLGIPNDNFEKGYNFHNHIFTVGFLDYFPYFKCIQFQNYSEIFGDATVNVCTKAIGMEAELLKEISRRLNFTYKLITYGPGTAPTYTRTFKKLISREIDIGIGGITRTRGRSERASFTSTYDHEDYNIFYHYKLSKLYLALNLIHTFSYTVWFVLICIIFLFGLLLHVYVKFKRRMKEDITNIKNVAFFHNLMVSIMKIYTYKA